VNQGMEHIPVTAHVRQREESFRASPLSRRPGVLTNTRKGGNNSGSAVVGGIVTVPSSLELLTHRLELLRAERAAAMTDTLRDETGDVADRATNVEASIRLQLLDERIAQLELQIADTRLQRHSEGVVSVGDVVQVDLGDGPEEYVVGSVEQVAAGVPTITPGSPLGRAIVGTDVGKTVAYEPRPGVRLDVRILDASARLAPSA